MDAEASTALDLLQRLPCLDGLPAAALQRLCDASVRRAHARGELLLAYPPHPSLGSASFDGVVALLVSGEATEEHTTPTRIGFY